MTTARSRPGASTQRARRPADDVLVTRYLHALRRQAAALEQPPHQTAARPARSRRSTPRGDR